MRIFAVVLLIAVLKSSPTVADALPPVHLEFKATTEHGYRLARLLYAAAKESKAIYVDNGRTPFLILDGVELAKRAKAGMDRFQ